MDWNEFFKWYKNKRFPLPDLTVKPSHNISTAFNPFHSSTTANCLLPQYSKEDALKIIMTSMMTHSMTVSVLIFPGNQILGTQSLLVSRKWLLWHSSHRIICFTLSLSGYPSFPWLASNTGISQSSVGWWCSHLYLSSRPQLCATKSSHILGLTLIYALGCFIDTLQLCI